MTIIYVQGKFLDKLVGYPIAGILKLAEYRGFPYLEKYRETLIKGLL